MSLYIEHFGLRELPFRITPSVQFFYRGCVRGETLDALKYAIGNGEGIMAIFGEVGTGKSMLCRMLMTEFRDKAQLVYIANPTFTDQEIVYHIAEELGLDVSREHQLVARDLQRQLLNLHNKNKRVLVFIDEAQAMPDASLEQIRLLSNLETSDEKIVQIILFGQPELSAKLEQRHMRQLRERVTSSFYLRKLNSEEVHEYITHRVSSASINRKQIIFSSAATAVIARVSQGISRRINILCDKAMLAAFADSATTVTATHARRAARDARYRQMEEDPLEAENVRHYRKTAIAGGLLLCAFAAIAYQYWIVETPQAEASLATSIPPETELVEPVAEPIEQSTELIESVTVTRAVAPPSTVTVYAQPDQTSSTQSVVIAPISTTITTIDNTRWQQYPPTSYLRQRLNATQTLFGLLELEDAANYTARILSAPRDNSIEIERYLRDLARFFTIRNVLIYPAVTQNKEVFVIAYGTFPSEFQAELFIHELPSFFRADRPFVQALAVSQLEAVNYW